MAKATAAKKSAAPSGNQGGASAEKKPKGTSPDVMINWKPNRALVIHAAHSGSLISKLSAADSTLTREEVKQMLTENKPLHIIPGIHPISAALWAKFEDHETIVNLIADEKLIVITKAMVSKEAKGKEDGDDPATNLPKDLNDLGANEAKDLIDGLVSDENLELLEKWQETEKGEKKRSSVLEALEKRIKTIKETAARFAGTKS